MPRPADPYRRSLPAIAALFCFLGFQYASWAARLPAFKSRLGIGPAELGLLLMACGAGAAVSFPLVAVLMRRYGSRLLSLGSALALVGVLLALSVVPDYPLALLVAGLDGVAVGCLNVAMNAQGAALEVRHGRTAMARLHATFSGGSLAGALLASGVNLFTGSVVVHFAIASLLLLGLLGFAAPGLLTEDPAPGEPSTERRGRLPLPTRITLWMGLAMAFGTVTEGAMNDWSALYLREVAHAGAELAPLGIAVVSVMMVLARVFADGWRSRWGDGRLVRLGSAVAAAGLALALLAGGTVAALLGFACMGLGMAAVTPCVYAAAARHGAEALSLVAAMGTTGLLGGPAVIGFIANGGGLVWGMAAVACSALAVSLCATRIRFPALEREAVEPVAELLVS
ncbi:MFS transporter [Kitasatospora viridis]|uniref:Putative MFS family arabinose efflux permease n=1 Tax=Kitasatospora viridis TaxID=281105 RepID=A0A561UF20_9ACTN|nr:MFS transporter [Kitasatospora viridis]TWF97977.1 putative MFS family arabinose efflux permease [Kitasatospora viridis]